MFSNKCLKNLRARRVKGIILDKINAVTVLKKQQLFTKRDGFMSSFPNSLLASMVLSFVLMGCGAKSDPASSNGEGVDSASQQQRIARQNFLASVEAEVSAFYRAPAPTAPEAATASASDICLRLQREVSAESTEATALVQILSEIIDPAALAACITETISSIAVNSVGRQKATTLITAVFVRDAHFAERLKILTLNWGIQSTDHMVLGVTLLQGSYNLDLTASLGTTFFTAAQRILTSPELSGSFEQLIFFVQRAEQEHVTLPASLLNALGADPRAKAFGYSTTGETLPAVVDATAVPALAPVSADAAPTSAPDLSNLPHRATEVPWVHQACRAPTPEGVDPLRRESLTACCAYYRSMNNCLADTIRHLDGTGRGEHMVAVNQAFMALTERAEDYRLISADYSGRHNNVYRLESEVQWLQGAKQKIESIQSALNIFETSTLHHLMAAVHMYHGLSSQMYLRHFLYLASHLPEERHDPIEEDIALGVLARELAEELEISAPAPNPDRAWDENYVPAREAPLFIRIGRALGTRALQTSESLYEIDSSVASLGAAFHLRLVTIESYLQAQQREVVALETRAIVAEREYKQASERYIRLSERNIDLELTYLTSYKDETVYRTWHNWEDADREHEPRCYDMFGGAPEHREDVACE